MVSNGTSTARRSAVHLSTEKEANHGGEKGEEVVQEEGQVAALRLPQRNGEITRRFFVLVGVCETAQRGRGSRYSNAL
jgi:hypothetical protein